MAALILFSLIIIVLCLVLPFVAMAKASRAQRAVEELSARLARLEKGAMQATHAPVPTPAGEAVSFPGPGKAAPSPTEAFPGKLAASPADEEEALASPPSVHPA